MLAYVIALVFITLGSPDPCHEGTSYWCKDYDTATECGVLEFCIHHQDFKEVSKKFKKKQTLWPLFVDGVQLPQG